MAEPGKAPDHPANPRRRAGTGLEMPVLGLGTWEMGASPSARAAEVRALQLGFDLGLTLVDTAEMYADGGAEKVVGEALRGRREGIVVVSKVLPQNASRRGTVQACERSLKRLGIDALDLYLLHWPGDHPFEDTLAGFLELRDAGKIRHFGVSNFDASEMRGAETHRGADAIAANQVLYNLGRRSAEPRLLPYCRKRGILLMAYSPLEQGKLKKKDALSEVAARHGATPSQVALAWTWREPGTVAVVKAGQEAHLRENAGALALSLSGDDLALLDRDYPPARADAPLETL